MNTNFEISCTSRSQDHHLQEIAFKLFFINVCIMKNTYLGCLSMLFVFFFIYSFVCDRIFKLLCLKFYRVFPDRRFPVEIIGCKN